MTKLDTANDILLEIKTCREEWPEEGKFKRWDEFMEEVVNALKQGETNEEC